MKAIIFEAINILITFCKGKKVGSLRNKRIAVSHIGVT